MYNGRATAAAADDDNDKYVRFLRFILQQSQYLVSMIR
jgi:hypothetical protein